MILAASSPFFLNLLKRNKHPHPLVYMKGVKSDDLVAIVDFLYYGEANVFQDNLDPFLALAEELRLKGLVGKTEDVAGKSDQNPETIATKPAFKKDKPNSHRLIESRSRREEERTSTERSLAIPKVVSGDLHDLDEKVKSMMEKSQNLAPNGKSVGHACKVCGKEGSGINIRDHIEANHLEGVSLPCNICGKDCRSRLNLRQHKCMKN